MDSAFHPLLNLQASACSLVWIVDGPVRWIEWNHSFQGHPPSRVRSEFVAGAATLLSTCYNLCLARWPVLCNLASKLVGLLLWLTTLLCTQHSIACTLVDRAVLPPHSGDHRRNASHSSPRLRTSLLLASATVTSIEELPNIRSSNSPTIALFQSHRRIHLVSEEQFRSSLHHVSLVAGPRPRLARRSPPLSRNKPPNYSRLPNRTV